MQYKFILFSCLFVSVGSSFAEQTVEDTSSPVIEFNSQMLMGNARAQDLSRFSRGNPVVPGTLRYDIYVNDLWIGRRDVEIVVGKNIYIGKVCLNKALVSALNIDIEKVATPRRALLKALSTDTRNTNCVSLDEVVENSFVKVNTDSLRINFSIPQLYTKSSPRGSVSKDIWDDGISGAVLNYSIQGYESEFSGRTSSSTLGLYDLGASVGSWRFRQSGSAIYQSSQLSGTNVNSSYFYKDIPEINGKLLLGTTSTNGLTFPNIKLMGLQIFSDDRMLPYSQQGYAPVIRGIARSNARVLITERGVPIYQTTVSAGPFEINDLQAGGYGGNLLVTVTESDGTESQFNVLFSATPQLLRPNAFRYDFAIGDYDGADVRKSVSVLQSSISYGLNDTWTLNGGSALAEGYASLAIGASFGSPIGSISLDLIGSDFSYRNNPRLYGESIKFGYAATIPKIGTNFAVAAYQNTSANFVPFDQAVSVLNASNLGAANQSQREQLVLSLSQSVGALGSFYGTASQTRYWNSQPDQTQFQLGWNRGIGKAFFSLNLSRQITNQIASDRIAANLIMPIGTGSQRVFASAGTQTSANGQTQSNVAVSGALTEDGRARYNANISDNGAGQTSTGINGTISTQYGILEGSTSNSNSSNSRSMGFRGGLVLHSDGLIASPPTGETITIVHAPGASGARIGSNGDSIVNEKGYGVLPYASPYSINNVELDLTGLPLDVSMTNTSQVSVPKSGAITLLKFESELSKFIVTHIDNAKELGLIYGTEIYDEKRNVIGYIGQGNKAQFHVASLDQKIFTRSTGQNSQEYSLELKKRENQGQNAALYSATAIPTESGQQTRTSALPTPSVETKVKPNERSGPMTSEKLPAAKEPSEASTGKWERISGLIRRNNGLPIPDNANVESVLDANGHVSNVNSSGQFATRVRAGTRSLRMTWGDKSENACLIDIQKKSVSDNTFECI